MKTKLDIQAQIDALNAVSKKLPAFNPFGDSYFEAIAAMIDVLMKDTPGDDIPRLYLKEEANASDFTMNCAFQSRDWLDEVREDDLVLEFNEVLASFGQ